MALETEGKACMSCPLFNTDYEEFESMIYGKLDVHLVSHLDAYRLS